MIISVPAVTIRILPGDVHRIIHPITLPITSTQSFYKSSHARSPELTSVESTHWHPPPQAPHRPSSSTSRSTTSSRVCRRALIALRPPIRLWSTTVLSPETCSSSARHNAREERRERVRGVGRYPDHNNQSIPSRTEQDALWEGVVERSELGAAPPTRRLQTRPTLSSARQVELDLVMHPQTPLWLSHDISQDLQDRIEDLLMVERAFIRA
ncbi:hypothetical protein CF336_g9138 [Tilletia laevis]|nr:hypothetical protein CF336_g9138 [Tilletia laevis]